MRKSAIAFHLGLLAATALFPQAARAEEKKDVYVTPNAQKKSLVNEALHGAPEKQVTIDHYVLPAGWVGGKHYHAGPVYVYVLEGVLAMDEQGKPRQMFRAGDVYVEPIGVAMQGRNPSASASTKILVIQVTPKGEPLMYKAE